MADDTSGGMLSSDQTKNTITGAVIGGLGTAAVLATAPFWAPALGLGAAVAAVGGAIGAVPWIGTAVGAYIGHNKSK